MSETLSERAHRLDVQRMIESLTFFSEDLSAAFSRFDDERPDWLNLVRDLQPMGILCLGMGGSGAGGRFLSTLCDAVGSIPVHVWRDYSIPSWVDERWLVIATSYSGNTEETLDAVETALNAGCSVIGISSGGVLAGLTEMHDSCYHIFVPGGRRPRAAFGHLFGTQIALLWQLGILDRPLRTSVENMLSRLAEKIAASDFTEDDSAQTALLAAGLLDQPLAIIASSEMGAAGERFANQINENAASFARVTVVPEMNHNEVVAWGGANVISDDKAGEQAVMLLDSPFTHPRIAQRMDWLVHNLTTPVAWRIRAEGESLLECLLHLCIMMDWTSCALALMREKDPSTTPGIDGLKRHLADREAQ